MLKTPLIAKSAVGLALAAMALVGASALPNVAAAQDCSGPSTIGGLAGAGLGAAAGSNLARGGGRTGGAVIGGVLGALVGSAAGRGASGCDRAPAYYNGQPQEGYYAPPPAQYAPGYAAAPPPAYYEAPPAYYEPGYASNYYYAAPPAVIVAPGYGYYGHRHWRGRRW